MDLDVYHEGRTLVLEGDNCFDLKPETLGQFLKMLDRKATDQGWNNTSSTQQIGLFNVSQDDSFYSKMHNIEHTKTIRCCRNAFGDH